MPIAQTLKRTLLAFLACGVLHACGDGEIVSSSPNPAEIEASAPAPANVVPPAGLPEVLPEITPPPAVPPKSQLTPDLHARFTRGLTLADARSLTSIEPIRVGGDGTNTEIYRWTDGHGASVTARFDDGLLTTSSKLGTRQAPGGSTPAPAAELDLETMPVAQIAPGVYVPLERAVTSATEQPLGTSALPEAPAPQDSLPAVRPAAVAPDGPTIAIAGAERREREANNRDSSYNPRATLPDFFRSIDEGGFEIRFLNPSDSPMSAGLRQDKLGKDITVPPKGKASIKVNRGVYQLFFLREDEPDTLFEAPTITIDGFQATDVEVHLDPENVEVRLIDYSKPNN